MSVSDRRSEGVGAEDRMALAVIASTARAWWYTAAKRVMDITIALAALLALSPLFLVVSILIKLDSSGPVFFRQTRLGKGRKEFTFLKFRSMRVDADQRVHEESFRRYAEGLPAEVSEQMVLYKPAQDPRVTRMGKWLRATSLDELPQLFNILTGDMSLVGPRPAISYELAFYQDWHYQRFDVLPGLTGIWQVYGRSSVPFEGMMRMDVDYVRNRSLWLELKLLLLTIPVILARKGAY